MGTLFPLSSKRLATVAELIEEILKLAVLLLFCARREAFDEPILEVNIHHPSRLRAAVECIFWSTFSPSIIKILGLVHHKR